MHRQSTNINLKSNKNGNSNRPKTTVYGQQQQNNGLKQSMNNTTSSHNITNGKPNLKNDSNNNLKNIKNVPVTNSQKTSTAEINLEMEKVPETITAFELPETTDSAIIDFTLERIHKWLQEMEDCNMMQPPSQLAWRDINNSGKPHNEFSRNFNNEYCLSDYDSIDEQIIEYNRVVDKTFHIVHDENADFVPEDKNET